MKASDFIAAFLHRRGVRQVFELSGGMITHMLDSLSLAGNIQIVSMHHEQAAAFAADAVGRMTGVPGVAMATSGPGATNLLTGIGSCFFDSSPAVFITGQVNRHELRGNRSIRQLGFQETDIVSIATPITKAAWQVGSPEELPAVLEAAFDLATAGRPGPVLVDIPMDVQRADVPAVFRDSAAPALAPVASVDVDRILQDLSRAERPLILAGGGVAASWSVPAFCELVQLTGTPVVTSLMARDVLPSDDPLQVGMIGSYGNRWVNLAIGACDYILVLGSRLDIRQTGADTSAFRGDRVIHHVDCEEGEINNRVAGCNALVADLRSFLNAALHIARGISFPDRRSWLADIDELRRQWPDTAELQVEGINPNDFMHRLSRACVDAVAYLVDVGQHQMWAAQSIEVRDRQRFLTSGGMGSMGFALPAAIGTSLATGSSPGVVIAGDGGFQSNIQELQTVVRNALPVKIVVVNNRCHGMVRQFQESYFDARYQSTYWGYSAPDFARVAEAYGLPAFTIQRPDEVENGVSWMWQVTGPCLLQVMVDTFANAYPKIAFGHPITEMEPLAKPISMEST